MDDRARERSGDDLGYRDPRDRDPSGYRVDHASAWSWWDCAAPVWAAPERDCREPSEGLLAR